MGTSGWTAFWSQTSTSQIQTATSTLEAAITATDPPPPPSSPTTSSITEQVQLLASSTSTLLTSHASTLDTMQRASLGETVPDTSLAAVLSPRDLTDAVVQIRDANNLARSIVGTNGSAEVPTETVTATAEIIEATAAAEGAIAEAAAQQATLFTERSIELTVEAQRARLEGDDDVAAQLTAAAENLLAAADQRSSLIDLTSTLAGATASVTTDLSDVVADPDAVATAISDATAASAAAKAAAELAEAYITEGRAIANLGPAAATIDTTEIVRADVHERLPKVRPDLKARPPADDGDAGDANGALSGLRSRLEHIRRNRIDAQEAAEADETSEDGAPTAAAAEETAPSHQDSDSDMLSDELEEQLGLDPNDADSDDDQLLDGDELNIGTDPLEQDTDADGISDLEDVLADADGDGQLDISSELSDRDGDFLTDGFEAVVGTDPDDPDSDADGIVDGEELRAGSDPLTAGPPPADAPPEEDSAPTGVASDDYVLADQAHFDEAIASGYTVVTFCADWCGPCRMMSEGAEELHDAGFDVHKVRLQDSSGDPVFVPAGLEYPEAFPYTVVYGPGGEQLGAIYGALDEEQLRDLVSAAADGLTAEEIQRFQPVDAEAFTEPGAEATAASGYQDTDSDWLSDEVEAQLGTDARNNDTDSDGINDGAEVHVGTDPLLVDTDGDGTNDVDEFAFTGGSATPFEAATGLSVEVADQDADGLSDGFEGVVGTDVTAADTDADGINDFDEVTHGTDPLPEPEPEPQLDPIE